MEIQLPFEIVFIDYDSGLYPFLTSVFVKPSEINTALEEFYINDVEIINIVSPLTKAMELLNYVT